MHTATDSSPARRPSFNHGAQARRAADVAAARSGVLISALEGIQELRRASDLLLSVWGPSPEGVPMSSEVMRSLVHADGLVLGAFDTVGDLVGATVLGRARAGVAYSYLAGTRPGGTDAGIGFALKQHQRAWALEHDIDVIEWTFDPLVSRNARFNLAKLGAVVRAYEPSFYGRMSDALNGGDDADRLVASWEIGSERVVAASEGTVRAGAETPPAELIENAEAGPDGAAAWIDDDAQAWCRVPGDIVALRAENPALASEWRMQVREWLAPALGRGLAAVGMSRSGWYQLKEENL